MSRKPLSSSSQQKKPLSLKKGKGRDKYAARHSVDGRGKRTLTHKKTSAVSEKKKKEIDRKKRVGIYTSKRV